MRAQAVNPALIQRLSTRLFFVVNKVTPVCSSIAASRQGNFYNVSRRVSSLKLSGTRGGSHVQQPASLSGCCTQEHICLAKQARKFS